MPRVSSTTRRAFLGSSIGAAAGVLASRAIAVERRADLAADDRRALVAITLDLEMSREYPARGMREWDFEKGNLDEATKNYAVKAARLVKEAGGLIHFFCVGRVLEQPSVEWLKGLAADGHPIGNHTYDHVNVRARSLEELQFRFQRAPWLVAGKSVDEAIRENIRLTDAALRQRAGIAQRGFRTPGGFSDGLAERPDLQKMLLGLGFRWVSSKYPAVELGEPKAEPTAAIYDGIVARQVDAQPLVYESGLVEIPMSPVSDVNAFRTNYWRRPWFCQAVRRGVQWAIDTGGCYDFLAHPSCLVVEDPECEAIKLICDLVRKAGAKAALADLDTLAERAKLKRPPER